MAQRSGHEENSSGSNWRALKCGAGGKWSEKVTNEQVLERIERTGHF